MNKKQFSNKLMASVLSALFLIPFATTFGVENEIPSSKTVSAHEKKVEETKNKKTTKKNPYSKAAAGCIGLGALIFGGRRIAKYWPTSKNTSTSSPTPGNAPVSPQAPAAPTAGQPVSPQAPAAPTAGQPVPPQAPAAPIAGQPVPPQAPAAPIAGQPVPPQVSIEENCGSWTRLHYAARSGMTVALQFVNINDDCLLEQDDLGRSPLYIAVKYNHTGFINYWLDHFSMRCPDYNYVHFCLCAVWERAATLNDIRTLRNLLNRDDCQCYIDYFKNPRMQLPGDEPILASALASGSFDAAHLLMQNGITINMSRLNTLDFAQFGEVTNMTSVLTFLKNENYEFKFKNRRRGKTNAYWMLYKTIQTGQIDAFTFAIDNLGILQCLPPSERDLIVQELTRRSTRYEEDADAALELFNQKCNDFPYDESGVTVSPAANQ